MTWPASDRHLRRPQIAAEPPRPRRRDSRAGTIAAAAAVVLVLVAGFVVLGLAGRDTSAYTLFLAGPIVSTLVGVIIRERVRVVEDAVVQVEAQTNGLLTARLDEIHQHLDVQTEQLAAASSSPSPTSSTSTPRIPAQAPATPGTGSPTSASRSTHQP